EIISKDAIPMEKQGIKEVLDQIESFNTTGRLFEKEIQGTHYFISFAKIAADKTMIVNMIKTEKIMMVQNIMIFQVLGFLILMASISLLVGTLSARWLTWHVDRLTMAAKKIESEDFDSKLEIHGTDEFNVLGEAFNSMGAKLKKLLAELKRHNEE